MKKLVFIAVLFLWGCENSFTPEFTLAWEPPVVESLPINNYSGVNDIRIELPVWNYNGPMTTIKFSEIKDLYVNFNPIYQNPNDAPVRPNTHISFSVESSGRVTLSILPARAPNESAQKVIQRFANAPFFKVNSGGVKLVDENLNSGIYNIPFDPVSLGLPSGFYVYILEANEIRLKREMYFAANCEEALPELREFMSDCRDEN